jgi:chromosome transmission fidelity protein 4
VTELNPFARKPVQDGRNPFARKPELNKNIQKSESFFDKVDAAESDAGKGNRVFEFHCGMPSHTNVHILDPVGGKGKGKEKEKKDARQTTLFGLPPGAPNEKKARGKKIAVGKDVEDARDITSLASGESLVPSGTIDVAMMDMSSQTLVETQPDELQESLQTQIDSQRQADIGQEVSCDAHRM